MKLRVRLQPRAASNELAGWREDPETGERVLIARVTAPPVDGKANAALVKLLAKEYSLPKSKIRILRGESSRDKLIELDRAGR
ncbi:MAG: DUF167 domain-containing protein [Solirubrobacterales bacterium]|nr:DUF167 domain-containing protein [Solirubrobacterales bacterium]